MSMAASQEAIVNLLKQAQTGNVKAVISALSSDNYGTISQLADDDDEISHIKLKNLLQFIDNLKLDMAYKVKWMHIKRKIMHVAIIKANLHLLQEIFSDGMFRCSIIRDEKLIEFVPSSATDLIDSKFALYSQQFFYTSRSNVVPSDFAKALYCQPQYEDITDETKAKIILFLEESCDPRLLDSKSSRLCPEPNEGISKSETFEPQTIEAVDDDSSSDTQDIASSSSHLLGVSVFRQGRCSPMPSALSSPCRPSSSVI